MVGQLVRGQRVVRDPDGEASAPGPAENDWIARPPRRVVRLAAWVREWQPARIRRILPDATAVTLYILMAGWISARYWKDPHQLSPVRPADNAWSQWLLAHAAHAVRHLQNPFAAMPVRIPGAQGLLSGTAEVGATIPLVPLTLWRGPEIAYLWWIFLAFAGTAATTYWVLSRHLVSSRVAAFVGASVCAFAPGFIWHANGQPSFITNFLVPLIVLRTVTVGRGRVLRNGILLGLLVTWQFLINPEVLVLTALAGGVAALWYLRLRDAATERTGDRRAVLRGLGVAVLTAAVLLAYPLWYWFSGSVAHAVTATAGTRGEDVTAIATYWRDSFAGNFTAVQDFGGIEQNSWFGWPLLLLVAAAVALVWRSSPAARVAVLTAAVFVLFGLGAKLYVDGHPTGIPGPWWLLGKVPGLGAIPPTRLALVVTACVGVLLAIASDRLPRPDAVSAGLTYHRVWVVAVAVALLPAAPRPLQAEPMLNATPRFITAHEWKQYTGDGRTVVPVPTTAAGVDVAMLDAASREELPVPAQFLTGPDLGGVLTSTNGMAPTGRLLWSVAAAGVAPLITDDMRQTAVADLRSWHAAILVLTGSGKREKTMLSTVSRLTGVEPHYQDGVFVWDVRSLTGGSAS
ncbi:MAG: DUF2029 domain-containing protein [Actinobacteria bacterium]|nr:MAG: DUF2029 domain-containing protein [Actinomycetota bacterium]